MWRLFAILGLVCFVMGTLHSEVDTDNTQVIYYMLAAIYITQFGGMLKEKGDE